MIPIPNISILSKYSPRIKKPINAATMGVKSSKIDESCVLALPNTKFKILVQSPVQKMLSVQLPKNLSYLWGFQNPQQTQP